MLANLIAAAVLSLGTSAIGKLRKRDSYQMRVAKRMMQQTLKEHDAKKGTQCPTSSPVK